MRNRRIETRSEMALVGIESRTTNKTEQVGADAQIPGLWEKLYSTGVPDRVTNKSGSGALLEMYTDYAGDETGEYTHRSYRSWRIPPAAWSTRRSYPATSTARASGGPVASPGADFRVGGDVALVGVPSRFGRWRGPSQRTPMPGTARELLTTMRG
jgi:hypothetical protein